LQASLGLMVKIERQYKKYLSSFTTWESKEFDLQWIIYNQDMGTRLANVEVPMSQVKLHTIARIKKVKIRKGGKWLK